MTDQQAKKDKGIIFTIGKQYLDRSVANIQTANNKSYILSIEQRKALRLLHLKTYALSALTGAIAVLVVILPFHMTTLFQPQQMHLFGKSFEFELYYTLYGIVMVFPEIWVLNVINMRAVKKACEIYKYPGTEQQDYEDQIAILTEAGLEMPNKYMASLEIDPYIGLSKVTYYTLFIFAKIKAALSNILIKLIVRRALGRYALRIVMDLVGVPVYAFWDAWASHLVMKEAQMRITSSAASKDFVSQFSKEDLISVRDKIPLLVNHIAQKKRSYNFALYAYIKELTKHYPGLSMKIDKPVLVKDLFNESEKENKILAQLMIFGFIVDGSLSVNEKLELHHLGEETWFPLSLSDVEQLLQSYIHGDSLVK